MGWFGIGGGAPSLSQVMDKLSNELTAVYNRLIGKGLGSTERSALSAGVQECLAHFEWDDVSHKLQMEVSTWKDLDKAFKKGHSLQQASDRMGSYLQRELGLDAAPSIMDRRIAPLLGGGMQADTFASNHAAMVKGAYEAGMLSDPGTVDQIANLVGGRSQLKAILASLGIRDVRI